MGVSIILLSLVLGLCQQSHQSERCLYSREDHLVCEYRNKNIERAAENQYSVHSTNIKETNSGSLKCKVKAAGQSVSDITDLGTSEMRIMYSPGFITGDQYDNELRVEYLVQCGVDELAFYNITQLNIQGEEDCQDDYGNYVCQDYVQIVRDPAGVVEECGNTTGELSVLQLEFGNFTVVFRTSEETEGEGFQMYVVCFKPAETALPNCFDSSEFNSDVCTSGDGSTIPPQTKRSTGERNILTERPDVAYYYADLFPGYPDKLRMRRDLATFHRQWNRLRGQAGVVLTRVFILYNQTVKYVDNTIQVLDHNTGDTVTRYGGVGMLQVFNPSGTIEKHIGQENRNLFFRGAGPLVIVNERAFLQLFVIDPRGLLPDEKELIELVKMNTPLLNSIFKDGIKKPSHYSAYLPSFPFIPSSIYNPRINGNANSPQFNESDIDAVLAAMRGAESCNAVLRAQSRATLTYYTELDQHFVESLSTFNISCSLSDSLLSCTSDYTTLPGRTLCQFDSQTPVNCEPFSEQINLNLIGSGLPVSSVAVTAVNCDCQTAKYEVNSITGR